MRVNIIIIAKKIRALFLKMLYPSERYFLAIRNLKPLSTKYGFDRGTPIDRYYIEKFMTSNKHYIKGMCLEVADNNYTVTFGKNKVRQSDIISNDKKNKYANILGDLQNLTELISNNKYDCVIMPQTLGMIPDYNSAIKEVYRILKKGGVLLLTTAFISPFFQDNYSYWRFTPAGLELCIKKVFSNYEINSFGNVLTSQCFWVGMAQEELTKAELTFNDPRYPLIVAVKAVK